MLHPVSRALRAIAAAALTAAGTLAISAAGLFRPSNPAGPQPRRDRHRRHRRRPAGLSQGVGDATPARRGGHMRTTVCLSIAMLLACALPAAETAQAKTA